MLFIPLLILLWLGIFITNFTPGTYLIGWDNQMPEFNLPSNFFRALFSVWQEYRGLGLLDGMSHASTLMHTIYIGIFSVIFPQNMLRYLFTYGTHLAGGIGIFFLIRYLLTKHLIPASAGMTSNNDVIPDQIGDPSQTDHRHYKRWWNPLSYALRPTPSDCVAFLASLFYMLNIGVIQMYFAPFEVFTMHFAALPILTLAFLYTRDHPTSKNYVLFFFVSFLMTVQSLVPTVFIAFSILFTFLFLFSLPLHRRVNSQATPLKTLVTLGIIFFCANAFWALPYLWSGTHTGQIIKNTRINQFSSEEIFYRNKAHGTISEVLFLKGFMIDTVELSKLDQNVYFMDVWKKHVESLPYTIVYSILLLIIGSGVGYSLFKKKTEYYPFFAASLIAFFFLANNTPGLDQANTWMRSTFPLVAEAFRFPFTKFITLFAFCLSVFFGLGLSLLLSVVSSFWEASTSPESVTEQHTTITDSGKERSLLLSRMTAQVFLIIGCSSIILYLGYPAFTGNFTSPLLRQKVPAEYQQAMSYLNTLDHDGRVALFPTYTFWNWQYRSWGQRGSGFIWQGVNSPIMERAFDPWSTYNEEFYNEIAFAVNSQDDVLFTEVIKKYDIKYIFLDQYLNNTLSTQPVNYNNLITFLNKSEALSTHKTFGRISVYTTAIPNRWVYGLDNNTLTAFPTFSFEKQDTLTNVAPNYISTPNNPDTVSLFPSLLTEKLQEDQEFSVKEKENTLSFTPKKSFPKLGKNVLLDIPNLFANEFLVPIRVHVEKDGVYLSPIYPSVFINNQQITLNDDPIILNPRIVKNPTSIEFTDIKYTVQITDDKEPQTFLINNTVNTLILTSGTLTETIPLDTSLIAKTPSLIPLNETTITSISLEVEKSKTPLTAEHIITNKLYELHKNEGDPAFKSARSYGIMSEGSNGVTMEAQEASNQLTFYKPNLFHDATYIMLISSTYESGLPIGFYLDNTYEKRAEVETQFSKSRTQNVIVIPKTQSAFEGYGFHFILKSLGPEIARSTIHEISLYPIPANTLKGIKIIRQDFDQIVDKQAGKIPLSYTRYNPSLYSLPAPTFSSYLVLSQSFDPAWKAYNVQNSEWGMMNNAQRALPFFFGKEINDHVLVNNWANGWKLDSGTIKQSNNEAIVILFLPQYLQYLGFLILPLPLLWFGIPHLHRKTHRYIQKKKGKAY